MKIEELDISPDMKGREFEERQFTIDKVPFHISTFQNKDGMKLLTFYTSTYPMRFGDQRNSSLQHHTQTVLDLHDAEILLKLLSHTVNYLKTTGPQL